MNDEQDLEVTAPYPGYLDRLSRRITRDLARHRAGTPVPTTFNGAPTDVHLALEAALDGIADEIISLSHDIHDHPEIGFQERHATEAIASLLRRHGFDIQSGAFGLETALLSRAGADAPCLAFLAEYDALPELGHACGHNIIAAASVGAYLASASVLASTGGSVALVGTPAEERGCGKELIARAGGFDTVDAALMIHPFTFDVAEHPGIGARQVSVTYRGLAAHAAGAPFLGRNALDAVVQAYSAIAQLRQHILPSDRIHGIITHGGDQANIIPRAASASFYIRSAEPETLRELSDRVDCILKSAAAATATAVEITWDTSPAYLPVRNNKTLVSQFVRHVAPLGRDVLPPGVVPVDVMSGSTDLGNVSVRIPAIHPMLAVAPPHVSTHHEDFTHFASSPSGDAAVLHGALGLAKTAMDFLSDQDFRAAVYEEFEAAGGALDVEQLFT